MSRHVVVVGGGAVGLFAALYVRRAGFDVTVVERRSPDYEGTSFGNAGLIVPSHFVPLAAPGAVALGIRWMFDPESPFYVRPSPDPALVAWGYRFWRASRPANAARAEPILLHLNRASRAEYLKWMQVLGNTFGLRESGMLMLCTTEAGLDHETRLAEKANGLGMRAQVLSSAEVAELQPGVRLNAVGGVFFPEDASLDPRRLMRTLRSRLEEDHVAFLWGVAVESLAADRGRVRGVRVAPTQANVQPRELIEADEVVLAAGIWSEALARPLGLRMPMRAGKGYSMTLGDAPELPSTPVMLAEGRVAVSPLIDGVRFGGTMEITGIREGVSSNRVRGIVKSAIQAFPSFREEHFRSAPVWYGFRPCSPDGLPYVGRTRHVENLIIATGHAMMGISLAPVTGRIVAELLEGRPTDLPVEALSPDRYG